MRSGSLSSVAQDGSSSRPADSVARVGRDVDARRLLEVIVESLRDGLVLVDTQGTIAHASHCLDGIVGWDVEQNPQPTIGLVWSRLAQDAIDGPEVRTRIAEFDAQS